MNTRNETFIGPMVTIFQSEYSLLKERRESVEYLKKVIEEQKQEIAQRELLHRMDLKQEKSNTNFYKVIFGLMTVIAWTLMAYIGYMNK